MFEAILIGGLISFFGVAAIAPPSEMVLDYKEEE